MSAHGRRHDGHTFGVGPEEVAHGAVVRDLDFAVDGADLVEGVDGWREAAVHAEDGVVDERRETQIVENLRAILPHIHRAVLPKALVVEPIHLQVCVSCVCECECV